MGKETGRAKVKLLLSCGVPVRWKGAYKHYMKIFEPEYYARIENRTLLPSLFKECKINFSEDIFENIFEYSDIPQPGK